MNLYLIGYRGSGKTTVAQLVSQQLTLPWIDADQWLVKQLGKTVTQIFAEEGEAGFRQHETESLKQLAGLSGWVIALGGGAILREENRLILAESGQTVWLAATPEVLVSRIAKDAATRESRPSLTPQGVLEEVQSVLAARHALYQASAQLKVDVDALSPAEVAQQIANWTKKQTWYPAMKEAGFATFASSPEDPA